jgi:hypothetical protein
VPSRQDGFFFPLLSADSAPPLTCPASSCGLSFVDFVSPPDWAYNGGSLPSVLVFVR